MKTKIICLALILISGTFIFSGCGKSYNNATNPTSNGTTPTATASVSIQNFAFSPSVVHLLPGGTVTWTNKDATAHTVTDNGGSFDSGSVAVDATFVKTFATAGTYTYHCTIHSMMASATVIVGN
ncbi:MAG: plastocyanin/azurin family copper-binding protein [Mucilaginibacter sp.]